MKKLFNQIFVVMKLYGYFPNLIYLKISFTKIIVTEWSITLIFINSSNYLSKSSFLYFRITISPISYFFRLSCYRKTIWPESYSTTKWCLMNLIEPIKYIYWNYYKYWLARFSSQMHLRSNCFSLTLKLDELGFSWIGEL